MINQLQFALQHLTGPRRGREDVFGLDRVAIGRGRNNQLAFDPVLDRTVSARHAEIRIEEGAVVLYDLGSLNGTYVNGSKVRRVVLSDGDEIGLGREGPRMRVLMRSGKTPSPIQPGDIPPSVAISFDPVMPDSAPARRRNWLLVACGVVALAALGLALFVLLRQERRLGELAPGGTPPTRDPGVAAAVQPTAPSMTAEPTGALLLRGVQLDASGRAIGGADVGYAVLVAPEVAATTGTVIETAQAYLAAHPGCRIVAWADGINARERQVTGFWSGPVVGSGYDGAISLLALTTGSTAWSTPQSTDALTSENLKSLAVRRPGIGEQAIWLEQPLRFSGARPDGVDSADLLSLRGLPATSPGAPIVDTTTNRLVGLSLGPNHPGIAIVARHLKSALDLIQGTPAAPLEH